MNDRRALIVMLDEGVTEYGAEELRAEIQSEYPQDVYRVEHFTVGRALELARARGFKGDIDE